jgi:hypothetical protein
VDLDFKDATDRKCIAVADCLDLRPGQKSRDGRVGPDSEVRVVQRRGPQSVRNEVIDMFVSDQNGVRSPQHFWRGERSRVDHKSHVIFF